MIAKLLSLIFFISSPAVDSMYPLNMKGAVCTAFVINKPKAIWMTASHCKGEEMIISDDRTVTSILFHDEGDDGLLVFTTDPRTGANYPALKLGKPPKQFAPVTAYGWGMAVFQRFQGEVLQPTITAPVSTTPIMLLSSFAMSGMSGGPVLDKDGKVISVVLGGFDLPALATVSFGSTYEHLKEVFEKYGK